MEKQEFLDLMNNIGTCEDEVQRRELIASAIEGASADYDSLAELTTKNENLTSDNEKLRDANMKLFLRVGESKQSDEMKKDTTGIDNKEIQKKDFKDLFDEKGGIK